MMKDLISVIVPVYKVEPYLDRCVQSIVDQTYRNLEIILVDDGSPDNCGAMCDAWAEKDSRIRVIHTKNQGSSAARNTALDLAQGNFIAFVDSDDYVEHRMLSHLYDLLEQDVDIAECAYVSTADDFATFDLSSDSVMIYTTSEAMREHIQDRVFQQVIWNKLYRRNVIDNIRFPIGKKIDDEFFTYQVIGRARALAHSEKVCYAYRQQPNSVMHTVPIHNWYAAIEAKCLRHEYILSHFPELAGFSQKSIIGSCLYLNQVAMRTADRETQTALLQNTAAVLAKYPLNKTVFAVMTCKERIWLSMAAISMPLACRIRNLLKIGL